MFRSRYVVSLSVCCFLLACGSSDDDTNTASDGGADAGDAATHDDASMAEDSSMPEEDASMTEDSSMPDPDSGMASGGGDVSATTLAVGHEHACAIADDGKAYCWGKNIDGQLGTEVEGMCMNGPFPAPCDADEPIAVDTDLTFVALAAGDAHTCGLTEDGIAYCWGFNNQGRLGYETTTNTPNYVPMQVSGGHAFTMLSTAGAYTCGVTDEGKAYCWGENFFGGLGNGSSDTDAHVDPTEVLGGHTFTTISAGRGRTCALDEDGAAWCWGKDAMGEAMCLAGATCSVEPVEVPGGHTFTKIDAGGSEHSCAIDDGGAAWCWGTMFAGAELGTGTQSPNNTGTPEEVVGGHTFVAIATIEQLSCAIDADGAAYCWGSDSFGQLGDGMTMGPQISTEPVAVEGGHDIAAIDLGREYACALTTDGEAFCWGRNGYGNLGTGMTGSQETPQAVVGGLTFALP